jgi:hypothetical protein
MAARPWGNTNRLLRHFELTVWLANKVEDIVSGPMKSPSFAPPFRKGHPSRRGALLDRFTRWRLAQGWVTPPINSMRLIAVMDRAAPAQAGKTAHTQIARLWIFSLDSFAVHIIATSTGPQAVSRMLPMA